MPSLVERLGYGPDAKLLIVNCDDLGSSAAANSATEQKPIDPAADPSSIIGRHKARDGLVGLGIAIAAAAAILDQGLGIVGLELRVQLHRYGMVAIGQHAEGGEVTGGQDGGSRRQGHHLVLM